MIIDIGGGSTEIIFGHKNKIEFKQSYLIGAVSLKESFVTNDPPSSQEISYLDSFLSDEFFSLTHRIPKTFEAIAVAGTPTTLSCIKQKLKYYDESKVEGSLLSLKDLIKLKKNFIGMTAKEIKSKFGTIVKGREDIILIGTLILINILNVLDIRNVYISGKGIRYGALINYLNKL